MSFVGKETKHVTIGKKNPMETKQITLFEFITGFTSFLCSRAHLLVTSICIECGLLGEHEYEHV